MTTLHTHLSGMTSTEIYHLQVALDDNGYVYTIQANNIAQHVIVVVRGPLDRELVTQLNEVNEPNQKD